MSHPASNEEKAKFLADQIDLRLSILNKKVKGEHADLDVPISLTKIREWVHGELGIQRIGSPSSFVTSHKEHGRKVVKIAKCLDTLKRQTKPPKKPKEQKLTELKAKNKELNESLTNSANKFVKYSQEIKRLREDKVLIKSKEEGLVEELDEVKNELQVSRDEIILLRKKLAQYDGNKVSKVTKVTFGKGGKNGN
jgi:predicted  nucleic acid-binding Zn-ribbon protein